MHCTLRDTLAGLGLGAALVAPLAIALPAAPAQAATPEPIVSGHRAATNVSGVPENSIPAVQYAGRSGASVVEVDARWTSDQYVVVLHDSTLDRTTKCTGPVEALTFAQLRKCADWRTVPALSNVYRYANMHGMAVNVEVKSVAGRPLTAAQARQLVARARTAGASDSTVFSSFSPTILAKIKAQPGANLSRFALITNSSGRVSSAVARSHGTVYMAQHSTLSQVAVDAYHARGVQVWAWGTKDYARLRGLGVDVIVADDPAAAKASLRASR